MITLILALISIFTLSQNTSQADEVYTFVIKKQEQKKATRWSLAEWLETKDRMRLMDLWLALHTPTPFEFYISGFHQNLDSNLRRESTGLNGELAAYATIFGLGLRKEFYGRNDWEGLFHLRLFGFHSQGTNLTLHAGFKGPIGSGDSRNTILGGSINFYLAKFFGIEMLYHHYFDPTSGNRPEPSQTRFEGGAFIDFSFVRVFGDLIRESAKGTGYKVGARIYF